MIFILINRKYFYNDLEKLSVYNNFKYFDLDCKSREDEKCFNEYINCFIKFL